jgi:hypothetical protein
MLEYFVTCFSEYLLNSKNNSKDGGQRLVGRLWIIFYYIRNYSPCLQAVFSRLLYKKKQFRPIVAAG